MRAAVERPRSLRPPPPGVGRHHCRCRGVPGAGTCRPPCGRAGPPVPAAPSGPRPRVSCRIPAPAACRPRAREGERSRGKAFTVTAQVLWCPWDVRFPLLFSRGSPFCFLQDFLTLDIPCLSVLISRPAKHPPTGGSYFLTLRVTEGFNFRS